MSFLAIDRQIWTQNHGQIHSISWWADQGSFKAVKIDASYLSQMTMYILIGVNDHQKTICMSGISKILAPFELTHFFPESSIHGKNSIFKLVCMYKG